MEYVRSKLIGRFFVLFVWRKKKQTTTLTDYAGYIMSVKNEVKRNKEKWIQWNPNKMLK